MDDNPEIDSWVMKDTAISELVEDEKQKLLYVFDYITERCFFIELSEIITGKDMNGAKCTKKSGDAPKQTVDFEEMTAAGGSLDLDENFYGDQDFDMEDFDQEGFDMEGGLLSAAAQSKSSVYKPWSHGQLKVKNCHSTAKRLLTWNFCSRSDGESCGESLTEQTTI